MKEVTVVARAKAKAGREAEMEKALRKVTEPTHQEAGCRRYAIHRGADDVGTFVVIERWDSKGDLDKHLASAHVQTFFQEINDLLAGPPELLTQELLPLADPRKGGL